MSIGFLILTTYFTVVSLVLTTFTLLPKFVLKRWGYLLTYAAGVCIIVAATFYAADELCFQLGHRIIECSAKIH